MNHRIDANILKAALRALGTPEDTDETRWALLVERLDGLSRRRKAPLHLRAAFGELSRRELDAIRTLAGMDGLPMTWEDIVEQLPTHLNRVELDCLKDLSRHGTLPGQDIVRLAKAWRFLCDEANKMNHICPDHLANKVLGEPLDRPQVYDFMQRLEDAGLIRFVKTNDGMENTILCFCFSLKSDKVQVKQGLKRMKETLASDRVYYESTIANNKERIMSCQEEIEKMQRKLADNAHRSKILKLLAEGKKA